tara:strand:- start:11442 stop:12263 length:822 start_codon:yes stop_codon:yes gene_type:complete
MYPGLEHINIDWYPPVLLVSGYSEIEQVEALAEEILKGDVQGQIQTVIHQSRSSQGATADCLFGQPSSPVIVSEHGVKYEVQPGVNQNAGFFLDMRPLRRWLMDYSKGKNVLNLFAYTCSLSVASLAGHARQVVSVDMSKPSINWGKRNHELNGQDLRSVKSMPHNLFKSWGKVQQFGPYDTVIIDPPTRQRGSFDAEKDYALILKKLDKFLKPNADVIATVNSPYLGMDFLPNLMQRYQSKLRLIGEMPASPEFVDRYPERALKIFHFRGPA